MGLKALVEPCFPSAALGGRCNGHGSTLVIPVPGVVRKMRFFSDGRIRRALALLDLAHRNLFALRRARPLVKAAFVGLFDLDRYGCASKRIGPSGPNPANIGRPPRTHIASEAFRASIGETRLASAYLAGRRPLICVCSRAQDRVILLMECKAGRDSRPLQPYDRS